MNYTYANIVLNVVYQNIHFIYYLIHFATNYKSNLKQCHTLYNIK